MKLINLPLNQPKTITTRKIMKLRKIKKIRKIKKVKKVKKIKKIKKRKIKTSKTSIVNLEHGIKKKEEKAKKNESIFGENSIQHIIQRASSLRKEININRKGNDEPITNINDNNINTQTNNIRLDDSFSNQNEIFSSRISFKPRPTLKEPALIFFYHNSSSDFCSEDELESEISNSPPTLFPVEVNNNRSNLIIENPNNNGSNIPLNNINNSNGNEFNPQNNNVNNNNQNIMHFHIEFDRMITSLGILRNREERERIEGRERIEIINIKNKLTQVSFTKTLYSKGSNEKCFICFEDFKSKQNVYRLSCHHLFHVDCLDKEIEYRQKCPICKKDL